MKKNRKRNPHKKQLVIDLAHIVIGLTAVGITVFVFLDLDHRMEWFPAVFVLAALLNFLNGIPRLVGDSRKNRQRHAGVALITGGVLLIVFAALSAFTLWR